MCLRHADRFKNERLVLSAVFEFVPLWTQIQTVGTGRAYLCACSRPREAGVVGDQTPDSNSKQLRPLTIFRVLHELQNNLFISVAIAVPGQFA